ncbi:hypothetical protein JCM10207_008560 [Rhodosporidiobolus poonsookiae]
MVQLNDTFDRLAVSTPSTSAKTPRARPSAPSTSSSTPSTPSALSPSTTALLSLLARLFAPLRRSPYFTPSLQTLKGLLYDKDYLRAFGSTDEQGERWREVYVSRWTPGRAVIYERVTRECRVAEALGWEQPALGSADDEGEEEQLARERERARRRREAKKQGKSPAEIDADEQRLDAEEAAAHAAKQAAQAAPPDRVDVLMVGGGAGSEVVALGCVLGTAAAAREGEKRPQVEVTVVDQGAWGSLLGKMEDGMRDEWPALAGSPNSTDAPFKVTFHHGDVLSAFSPSPSTPPAPPVPFISPSPSSAPRPSLRLTTILFTITELLLQSRPSTLRLFSALTQSTTPGALLLVVESASLALIPLGTSGRTYPLGQLLDHALCGGAGGEGAGQWEKVKSDDARWFRMPEGADEAYNPPSSGIRVKLENSRVVLRLYRRK